jgi:hypothetical protein
MKHYRTFSLWLLALLEWHLQVGNIFTAPTHTPLTLQLALELCGR